MDDDQDGRRINLMGVGAAIFVLALAVIAVVILIAKPGAGHGNKTTSTQAQAATPGTSQTSTMRQSSTTAQKVAAKPGVCSLPAGSQQVPSASPPAGTSWGQVGAMVTPQATRTLGPQWQEGAFPACFAHNPSGALLAAINIWAVGTTTPDGRLMRHYAVDAPAGAFKPTSTLGETQFAGYKYDSYSSHLATVDVVLKQPSGGLEAIRTAMVWVGGSTNDWRYQFPPAGDPAVEALNTQDVEPPYISWSNFGN